MSERCEHCSVQEPPNYNNSPREHHPSSLQNGVASSLLPSSSHLPFIFPHAWKVLITQRALMARRKCPEAITAQSELCPALAKEEELGMTLLGHKVFPVALCKGPHFSESSEQLFYLWCSAKAAPVPLGWLCRVC